MQTEMTELKQKLSEKGSSPSSFKIMMATTCILM